MQYLCYLPKNATRNTSQQQQFRRNSFNNLRTTNHWPYLMATVPEQPMSYNFCNPDDPIFIDYESLPVPNLEDLKAEFSELPHERGTLSMARSADPNSANSQFFICFDSAPHLDRQYSAFGKVIKGMEFVDMLKKGDPNSGAVPNPDKIISIKSK